MPTRSQVTDTTVPDPKLGEVDVERASESSSINPDPFHLRDGYQTDVQLAQLRQRRRGNVIVKYQGKQNRVRFNFSRILPASTPSLTSAV